MNNNYCSDNQEDEEFPIVDALVDYLAEHMPKQYALLPILPRLKEFNDCLSQLRTLYQTEDIVITSKSCGIFPSIMYIIIDSFPEFAVMEMLPFSKAVSLADSFEVSGDLNCHIHIALGFQNCYKQISLD